MNRDDIFSGKAGLVGIQSILNGRSSRRQLRHEAQRMLQPGYRVGPLHLTRAKFKPERRLLAYFTFPTLDTGGQARYPIHLAVSWLKDLEGGIDVENWHQLQEEARRSGLMPVQSDLWRDRFDRGFRLQIWPFDPKFPQLVRLGNTSYVAEMFSSLGIGNNLYSMPIVTPLRYRPGERHVLRYELCPPGLPDRGDRLYAKLYSNSQDTAKAFGIANRVVDWLTANPMGLQGNRPLAMSLEDGVIFYPHAPGIPLSHLLNRSRRWLADQLHTIGRGLALLHRGPEALQADLKHNTFSNEARVVRRASEHIQVLLPDTCNKIIEIVEIAQEQYEHLPQEEPTFTHSDFKSDHLLSTPQGVTLIDFDTCTLTDPAMDIGKFLADLDWWFALKGISGVREAQAELLRGYQGEVRSDRIIHERLKRARFFHVLILVKIVVRRVPIYRKDWAAITSRMIEKADQILHEAVET